MSTRRVIYWAILITTISVFLVMQVWTIPIIRLESGGGVPFETRIMGYDPAAVREFLTNLTPRGYIYYLGPQLRMDQFFPGLLAVSLSLTIWLLTNGWSVGFRSILVGLAVFGFIFDTLENHLVEKMLRLGPVEITNEIVWQASLATQLKFVMFLPALLTVFFLIWNSGLSIVQSATASK